MCSMPGISGVSLDVCAAVHELAASEIPKAFLFRGSTETTAQQVAKMLGLGLVQFKRQAGMPASPFLFNAPQSCS